MSLPLFATDRVDAARLDAATVGRVGVLDRLTRRLQEISTSAARPHTLLVGAAGSGKTHTLAVALHRAGQVAGAATREVVGPGADDTREPGTVEARLHVARLPEDGLGIGSYEDLLVEALRSLSGGPAVAQPPHVEPHRWVTGLEQQVLAAAGGGVVLLAVDNLERVFDGIGRPGQAALRGFVESSAQIVVLATAPRLFRAVSSRTHPWYGSFDTEHLDDLTLPQGSEIVRRAAVSRGDAALAKFVETGPGQARLAALAAVLGGTPRAWQALAERTNAADLRKLTPAVLDVLQVLAPTLHLGLLQLSPGEQKLVLELGRARGPRTVNDLAARVGSSNRAVASSLGRLSDAGWVRGRKQPGTDQRLTFYELRDVLLRRHLQHALAGDTALEATVAVLLGWHVAGAGVISHESHEDSGPTSETARAFDAVLDRSPRQPGQRAKRLGEVSAGLHPDLTEVLASVVAAADGDPDATARLPTELRSLVSELRAADSGSGQSA